MIYSVYSLLYYKSKINHYIVMLTQKIASFYKSCITSIANQSKLWKGGVIGGYIGLGLYTALCAFPYIVEMEHSVLASIAIFCIMSAVFLGLTFVIGRCLQCLSRWIKFLTPHFARFLGCCITILLLHRYCDYIVDDNGSKFIFLEVLCGIVVGISLPRGRFVRLLGISSVLLVNILIAIFAFSSGTDSSSYPDSAYLNQYSGKTIGKSFLTKRYDIATCSYGSGTNKHIAAYGDSCQIITSGVDASSVFQNRSKFDSYFRNSYWGFDSKCYPINGRIWYPQGDGPFPLVLIVHGNHYMQDFSDNGYDYIGKLLAARGYIVASVDENFLNRNWSGDSHSAENLVRGWLILKHLEEWHKWNNTPTNPFYHKIDTNNIALIGHSRGGEAVAIAAWLNHQEYMPSDRSLKLDFNFNIKAIATLAPVASYQIAAETPLTLENVDYLLIQGGHDQDVSYMAGLRYYNSLKISDNSHHFKASLYCYHANHCQFNRAWGNVDKLAPLSVGLNQKPIMSAEQQREIAKVYLSVFLDASIKHDNMASEILKDYRKAFDVLPQDFYVSQYHNSDATILANFEEDSNLSTATMAGATISAQNFSKHNETVLKLKDWGASSQLTSAVMLEWKKADAHTAPYYTISLDSCQLEELAERKPSILFFSIGKNCDAIDCTIRLSFCNGVQKDYKLSELWVLPPILRAKLTKINRLYPITPKDAYEQLLQYVEIPVPAEISSNGFGDLSAIQFIFSNNIDGSAILDNIGFY